MPQAVALAALSDFSPPYSASLARRLARSIVKLENLLQRGHGGGHVVRSGNGAHHGGATHRRGQHARQLRQTDAADRYTGHFFSQQANIATQPRKSLRRGGDMFGRGGKYGAGRDVPGAKVPRYQHF